jgi:hypothetical protein
VFIKEHNADYLSDETLRWHPKLGIHSVNVAPEFGVEETRAFIALLKENKMFALADEFIDMAYSSGKWKKWLAPNSKAGKKVKAEIAGHYVFMEPEFHEIKAKADKKLKKQNIDIDEHLKNVIKTKICRYLRAFRII